MFKQESYLCKAILLLLGVAGLEAAWAFRDPTEPRNVTATGTPIVAKKEALILTAIMISGDHRNAVINNVMVKEGDKIANGEIERIEPYSVTFIEHGKKTVIYLLGEGSVKEAQK